MTGSGGATATAFRGTQPFFVANKGQWAPSVEFTAQCGGLAARFEADSVTLAGRGRERCQVVRLTFENSDAGVTLVGEAELPGRCNYFIGHDSARWRAGVPTFERIVYRNLYPGIDVDFHWNRGLLEYDVVLAPGADLGRCRIRCDGAGVLALSTGGDLLLDTAPGALEQALPRTWQEGATGTRIPLDCRFDALDSHTYGFQAPNRDSDLRTVIDPGLDWSTFLGGSAWEQASDVSISQNGAVTVAGDTASSDFPIEPGAYQTSYMGPTFSSDAFVTQLAPGGGSLVFSTYLGGASSGEVVLKLAVDDVGMVTVMGETGSTDFPTTPGAFDGIFGGWTDAFVTRLNASGSQLIYSTYIGGSHLDEPRAMCLLDTGEVILTGGTESVDYPVTAGAYDTTPDPNLPLSEDAFVTKIAADGRSLVFSTFLGGAKADAGTGIASDSQGCPVIAGNTDGSDFPTTVGAFDTTPKRMFISRLSPDGSALLQSTYLGGSGTDGVDGLALGPDGSVTVTGYTESLDFPITPLAFQPSILFGQRAAFITRLDPTLSALVWSTYLGGGSEDEGMAIRVDSAGTVTLCGQTRSGSFPTTAGAFLEHKQGGFDYDVFVSRLNATGSKLLYSTYLGGMKDDIVTDHVIGLAIGSEGEAVVAGRTISPDFPVQNPYQGTIDGAGGDAYVAKLDMLPTGVSKYGASTPGCKGKLWMNVTAMPKLGSSSFGFACTNADPGTSPGVLVLGVAGLNAPVPAKGAQLWVSPFSLFLLVPATFNALGYSELAAPIPNDAGLANLTLRGQFFAGSSRCAPNDWAASNALTITLQP